jgi:hypothetical protein
VRQVTKDGHTFCPATFKSSDDDFEKTRRRKENFSQLQLLALDFDKGISFDAVKDRAENYDLPVLFAYETFSSRDHDKFRVVFLNDCPVTNIKVAELMLKSLATIFPEADQACKSPVHMFFGSNKGPLYFDDSLPTLDAESIIRNTTNFLEDKYGTKHYKEHIEKLARDTGVALNEKRLLDVSVVDNIAETTGASPNSNNLSNISTIVEFGRKFPNGKPNYLKITFGENSTRSLGENKKSNYHLSFRSSDLKTISASCQLFKEFIAGNRRLEHMELFGIATNLVNVETGAELFSDTLQEHSYYETEPQKYRKWQQDVRNIRDYKPYACDRLCPYSANCTHGTNILSTAKPKNQIERLPNYVEYYVTIEESAEDFRRQLDYAIGAGEKKWYIIKAQTALGKTETYLQLLINTSLRILIAVPTNKLKMEVRQRAFDMGIEIIESPSPHEIEDDLPDDVWKHIKFLYDSGRSVIPYLRKLLKGNGPEYSKSIGEYLRRLEDFHNFEGHAVTTHQRLPFIDTDKYDVVIIDEDIIFNRVIQNKTEISVHNLGKQMKKMKKIAPGSAIFEKMSEAIQLSKHERFFTLPAIDFDKKGEGKPTGFDIPSFCAAEHFYVMKASDMGNDSHEDCIQFLNPVHFKPDTKYIMVSATVDKTICEYYFGKDNIEFYECSRAKNTGTLNQYGDKSMSRAFIRKDRDIIKRIKKWSGFEHTITFLEFEQGYDCMHFGNTAGRDEWKGENIDVIGTPHLPGWIYKLFAYTMGIEFDLEATINPRAIIERNGYRFPLAAYEDKPLQDIQCYMIESELEQAAGRSRLLRCDCAVNLYSNFPLRQAVMKKPEY